MNKWWLLAFIVWSMAMFTAGYKYDSHKSGETAALKVVDQQQTVIGAEAGVIGKERADNKATNEVSHDYQAHNSAIDSLYDGVLNGLQFGPHNDPGGMPSLSNGQPGHNGTACTNGLSGADKKLIVKSSRNAEKQTARLVACQAWIRTHGGAP